MYKEHGKQPIGHLGMNDAWEARAILVWFYYEMTE